MSRPFGPWKLRGANQFLHTANGFLSKKGIWWREPRPPERLLVLGRSR
jgi:hypothetical protein